MVIGKGRRKKEGEGFSHGLISFFFDSQNRMNESMHACLRGGTGGTCTKTTQDKAYQNILVGEPLEVSSSSFLPFSPPPSTPPPLFLFSSFPHLLFSCG